MIRSIILLCALTALQAAVDPGDVLDYRNARSYTVQRDFLYEVILPDRRFFYYLTKGQTLTYEESTKTLAIYTLDGRIIIL